MLFSHTGILNKCHLNLKLKRESSRYIRMSNKDTRLCIILNLFPVYVSLSQCLFCIVFHKPVILNQNICLYFMFEIWECSKPLQRRAGIFFILAKLLHFKFRKCAHPKSFRTGAQSAKILNKKTLHFFIQILL